MPPSKLTYCPTCSDELPKQIEFEWDAIEARLTLQCVECDTIFTVVYIVACVEDVELTLRSYSGGR